MGTYETFEARRLLLSIPSVKLRFTKSRLAAIFWRHSVLYGGKTRGENTMGTFLRHLKQALWYLALRR